MPEYTIRDPQSGKTVTVRGDSPPTEAELEAVFREVRPESSTDRERRVIMQPAPHGPRDVTFGDLMANPSDAAWRAVQGLASDLTDPKTILPILAGVGLRMAGPTMMRAAGNAAGKFELNPSAALDFKVNQPLAWLKNAVARRPDVTPPAAPAGRLAGAAPTLNDSLISVLNDLHQQGQPTRVDLQSPPGDLQAAMDSMRLLADRTGARRTTPVSAPTPPAAAPKSTPTPALAASSPRPARSTGTAALPSTPSMSPAEEAQAVQWIGQGVPPETILQRILMSRQLTGKLGTPTPDEAARAVTERNLTGRWQP